jgi:phenylacetic acid degradation operon negative regulatory protein
VTGRSPLPPSEAFQPQDLVITMLGVYARPSGEMLWSGGLVTLLGEFDFSQGAARVALNRLVRRGLIDRVREGRHVHYRVTPRCDRLLAEGDGRIFSLGSPHDDGSRWTVLLHQIPEDRRLERGRLARRLRFLGFGSVQDSVWVSPHDHSGEVGDLVRELEVADFATVLLAGVEDAAGLSALATRAWDLSELAERYDAFCTEFAQFEQRRLAARLSEPEAFVVRTRLTHLFRGFPLMDPELPDELAPLGRSRARAVDLFHGLYEGLAERSQRHFDAVTLTGGAAGSAAR